MNFRTLTSILLVASFMFSWRSAHATEDAIFIRTQSDGSVVLSNVPAERGFRVFMSSPASSSGAGLSAPAKASGSARAIKLPDQVEQYRELVAEAAKRTNVEARLLHAVIAVESGYNPRSVSSKGAIGLMQLMPNTVLRYSILDVNDPQQNIIGGASYLRDLLKLFNNDVSLALAAYNAGENAVLRYGSRIPPYPETTAYVPKVLAVYKKLENLVI